MPLLLEEALKKPLPVLYKVTQHFKNNQVENVRETMWEELEKAEICGAIQPGMKIAVAVGSRGIDHLKEIVKTVIDYLLEKETVPVIIAAMGSHGGGTVEGQLEILHGYGITEEEMGVPVMASNDTVLLGHTSGGHQVYFDRYCHEEADLILPINRIKLHTDFVDTIQSGLCKMLVIGLGHHRGCSSIHECEFSNLGSVIKEAASMILEKEKVGFGVGILENAYDHTMMIEAVAAAHFIKREEELVKIAIENMPVLPFDQIDVLVVERIGKDISGAGFDPNILGRSYIRDEYILPIPEITRMILLDLSEATHGNAIGIGSFDITTRKVFDQLDLESIYANAIAIKTLEDCKIPLVAADEEEAIRVGIYTLRDVKDEELRMVHMKDTLHLDEFYVSETCLKDLRQRCAGQIADGSIVIEEQQYHPCHFWSGKDFGKKEDDKN